MRGIMNGMVMQRNSKNRCEITLIVSPEEMKQKKVICYTGTDGIAHPLPLTDERNGRFLLEGIPVGGPYTVTCGDIIYTDIYVGDVWLLAGQSNMEGLAEYTKEDEAYAPSPLIRELHMGNYWMPAEPTLHKLYQAYDKVHTEVLGASEEYYRPQIKKRCIGPGLFFAHHMFDYEGVPQGVIPCAHGGTSMAQWDPSGRDQGGDLSLYGAMYRRFIDNGSHVRGLFWYQGCSDASYAAYGVFEEKLLAFYQAVRRDFGAGLPIVQVQIARVYPALAEDPTEGNVTWTGIRDIQRKMSGTVEGLATAYTISYSMADPIHIARKSQKKLAENAAELMHALIHGQPAPEIGVDVKGIVAARNDFSQNYTDIIVPFTGITGLTAEPYPVGFSLLGPDGKGWSYTVYKTVLDGNRAIVGVNLTWERLKELNLSIAYGYGMCPSCNLTDSRGFSVPAFGPVTVSM